MLVVVHGGATSAARAVLELGIPYWTSRGYCVADVDHRGSTGYGRRHREALKGRWGVVDLDDVIACARHLADAGRASSPPAPATSGWPTWACWPRRRTQGDEDEVVPPDQAEMIVAALRHTGVPHVYRLFAGVQHGFRKSENIRPALDGELSSYAQVWGFDLPAEEGIEPVEVVRG